MMDYFFSQESANEIRFEEGINKGIVLTARNMLDKGIAVDLIAECTGLSTEYIKTLAKPDTNRFNGAEQGAELLN